MCTNHYDGSALDCSRRSLPSLTFITVVGSLAVLLASAPLAAQGPTFLECGPDLPPCPGDLWCERAAEEETGYCACYVEDPCEEGIGVWDIILNQCVAIGPVDCSALDDPIHCIAGVCETVMPVREGEPPYICVPETLPDCDCNENGLRDECDIDCGALGGTCDWPGCGESPDCQPNVVPDECDLADGTSEDVNSNGIPDECEPWISNARTCRGHGAAGMLCLDVGLEDELGVEPRLGGVQWLELEVSVPLHAASVSGAHVQVACLEHAYTGDVVASLVGDGTVVLCFGCPLPDRDSCEITLDGMVSESDGYAVPNGCTIVTLEGDVTRDGKVTSVDSSAIKPRLGALAQQGNAVYDLVTDGVVNSLDVSAVKPRFGHKAPECP